MHLDASKVFSLTMCAVSPGRADAASLIIMHIKRPQNINISNTGIMTGYIKGNKNYQQLI